jgi:hypothetical protein
MFRANRLKREHPDWLIGTPEQKPKFGAWSAVDFTREEIRDLAFRYVEEVCRNYDVDGVEIDFFRHPVFFKRAAQTGTECNDEERRLMTELMRRIRAMTEVEGIRRGRPFLVAMRVPDSVEYCRATGIDLERWLADGLLDLLITGGYFQINEPAYSAALARKHGVKFYPSLDDPRVRDEPARKLRTATAAYRGRALSAWAAGADGVYLFNSFNPRDSIWRELGSPALLMAAERDYFASVLGQGAAAGGAYPQTTFITGEAESAAGNGRAPAATLRLHFKRPPDPAKVTISLNGTVLSGGVVKGEWIEAPLLPGRLRPGGNAVRLELAAGAAPAVWTDLHCTVRPLDSVSPRVEGTPPTP